MVRKQGPSQPPCHWTLYPCSLSLQEVGQLLQQGEMMRGWSDKVLLMKQDHGLNDWQGSFANLVMINNTVSPPHMKGVNKRG